MNSAKASETHGSCSTTTALLERLHDPADGVVWGEFDGRLRPILVGLAGRLGLSMADAEDAAQEALSRFVTHYRAGRYDRARGGLRAWMISIARHCIVDAHRARAARREGNADVTEYVAPQLDEIEAAWDHECAKAVVQQAMEELRGDSRFNDRTIRAFELVAIEQRPVAAVAEEVGISIDSVYAAKSRCTKRLRELIARRRAAYELE